VSAAASPVLDYDRRPLTEGAPVIGYRGGVQYTGTLSSIDPPDPGCEGHRHVTVIRDDNHRAQRTTSDALTQPA